MAGVSASGVRGTPHCWATAMDPHDPHVRPLPPQPNLTRQNLYQFVFSTQSTKSAGYPTRDLFVAALEAEGHPL